MNNTKTFRLENLPLYSMYNVQHQAVPIASVLLEFLASVLLEFLASVLLTLRARCLTVCSLELTQAMCRGVWLSAGLRMSFSSGHFLKISSTALQNTYIHAVRITFSIFAVTQYYTTMSINIRRLIQKGGQINKSGLHSTYSVHIYTLFAQTDTYGRKPSPAASISGEKRLALSSEGSAPAVSRMGMALVR